MKINIRKARERFSEIVNLVSIKGERIVLTSKNKPKAAIVSLKDLEVLEDRTIRKAKRLNQLERIKTIRKRLSLKGVVSDSVLTLKRIREERIGEL
jgi:prevent-host-death family protein